VRVQVGTPTTKSGATGALRKEGPSRVRRLDTLASSRRWLAPAAIVLLALTVRVAVVAADGGYQPRNDALEYDLLARSIAAGDGYTQSAYLLQGGPTAIRGPGYPYALGAIYAVSGDSQTAGRLAGAALGALAVLFLFLIVKRIWGRRIGLVAAGLAAVFPPLVLLSRDLLSESLFIVLALGAVLCVLNFRRSGGMLWWAAAAGTLCGLAALTRNTGVVLMLAVALGVLTVRPRLRMRALAAPAVVLACTALAIAPWAIRNAIEFGRFIPLTTSAGIATGGTYNESSYLDGDTHGAWRDPQVVPRFNPLFVTPGIDEGTVDASLRREAREFAWEHPGYVAETSTWNLLRMFELASGSVVDSSGNTVDDRGIGSATPASERIALAMAAALALLGGIALIRSRGSDEPRSHARRIPSGPLFLWLIPVLMILTAAPIAGLPRYRLPADPFLLILPAIGLVWLWDRIARRPAGA
jgi:4-amino-4-deoxy-L-arabinose transferase-like glycosyltransferase